MEIGQIVTGRQDYRLVRQLGTDGLTAQAFLATQLFDQATVVIKTPHHATEGLERMKVEAETLRRIGQAETAKGFHYAIRLLEDGTNHTPPFLVLEQATGQNVWNDLVERVVDWSAASLDEGLVLDIATHLARALQTAHGANIRYDDLKLDSLFWQPGEAAPLRIIDWNVVSEVGNDGVNGMWARFGICLFELLTGAPQKFDRQGMLQGPALEQHPRWTELPLVFRQIIGRAVQRKYHNDNEVLADLDWAQKIRSFPITELISQARVALGGGQGERAQALLDRARRIEPNHRDLAALENDIDSLQRRARSDELATGLRILAKASYGVARETFDRAYLSTGRTDPRPRRLRWLTDVLRRAHSTEAQPARDSLIDAWGELPDTFASIAPEKANQARTLTQALQTNTATLDDANELHWLIAEASALESLALARTTALISVASDYITTAEQSVRQLRDARDQAPDLEALFKAIETQRSEFDQLNKKQRERERTRGSVQQVIDQLQAYTEGKLDSLEPREIKQARNEADNLVALFPNREEKQQRDLLFLLDKAATAYPLLGSEKISERHRGLQVLTNEDTLKLNGAFQDRYAKAIRSQELHQQLQKAQSDGRYDEEVRLQQELAELGVRLENTRLVRTTQPSSIPPSDAPWITIWHDLQDIKWPAYKSIALSYNKKLEGLSQRLEAQSPLSGVIRNALAKDISLQRERIQRMNKLITKVEHTWQQYTTVTHDPERSTKALTLYAELVELSLLLVDAEYRSKKDKIERYFSDLSAKQNQSVPTDLGAPPISQQKSALHDQATHDKQALQVEELLQQLSAKSDEPTTMKRTQCFIEAANELHDKNPNSSVLESINQWVKRGLQGTNKQGLFVAQWEALNLCLATLEARQQNDITSLLVEVSNFLNNKHERMYSVNNLANGVRGVREVEQVLKDIDNDLARFHTFIQDFLERAKRDSEIEDVKEIAKDEVLWKRIEDITIEDLKKPLQDLREIYRDHKDKSDGVKSPNGGLALTIVNLAERLPERQNLKPDLQKLADIASVIESRGEG